MSEAIWPGREADVIISAMEPVLLLVHILWALAGLGAIERFLKV